MFSLLPVTRNEYSLTWRAENSRTVIEICDLDLWDNEANLLDAARDYIALVRPSFARRFPLQRLCNRNLARVALTLEAASSGLADAICVWKFPRAKTEKRSRRRERNEI